MNKLKVREDRGKETRKYVCSYYHDGTWWSIHVDAYDQEDAEARVKKLGNLKVDGRLVASFSGRWPVWVMKLFVTLRNSFERFRAWLER